jgi:hypothetical protein
MKRMFGFVTGGSAAKAVQIAERNENRRIR